MRGILPSWLTSWFGLPEGGPDEGVVWSLQNTWSWAPWLTLLFIAFVVLWVVYWYSREAPASRAVKALLVALRLTLVALLACMIAELMISLERTGLPTIVVVIDDSASMSIADRYEDEAVRAALEKRVAAAGLEKLTRMNLVKSVLLDSRTDWLALLGKHYKLRFYFVSAAARPQPETVSEERNAIRALEPTGESSRLGAGLRSVLADLRGTPPAAILLFTDGVNTDGESLEDAARHARQKAVPIFTIGLGSEQPPRDLDLADLLVDEAVFVDDVIDFQCKLTGQGLGGRTVEIVLREKDNPTVLAREQVVIDPEGKPQTVHLTYRPKTVGEFEYVVEVEPLAEETQTDNNRQQRLVSVRRERVNVLLVQSGPSYEFRYLKNMLQRDPTIHLKTVLQEADPEYVEQDQTALSVFPVRRQELFEYDVILFGDVNPAFLSASVMSNINDFVEQKGGGIAFLSGPRFTPVAYRDTPLAPLFPVDLGSVTVPASGQSAADAFTVEPTDLGLSTPPMQLGDTPADTVQIWQQLPKLYWLLEADHSKPAARVLATHPTKLNSDGQKLPIICMQYVGAGKVLFHATDETWRWRYRVGDVFFAHYWVQAIRYLSRSKLLGKDRSAELTADRREYRRGDVVRLRARFTDDRVAPAADDGVTVVVEQEGAPNRPVKLQRNASNRGVFEGLLSDLTTGRYHAWIAEPTLPNKAPAADFLVLAPPGEFERVQMDAGELTRVAEVTHGRFYRIADVSRLLRDLPAGHQVPIESLPPHALWNQWWLLCLFLLLLTTEWILRKRKGML